MSEAKEGKLFGRKKFLDPHLGTNEGTKITSTIIFYTSHALTVYSSVQWAGVGWYVADSAFLLPELSRHDSSFCIPAPVLSGQESRQLFLFKTKLIIYLCILQFENL